MSTAAGVGKAADHDLTAIGEPTGFFDRNLMPAAVPTRQMRHYIIRYPIRLGDTHLLQHDPNRMATVPRVCVVPGLSSRRQLGGGLSIVTLRHCRTLPKLHRR
ncbi:MAG: hypothetical protein ACRYFW_11100 [Janthinobacterium lividum]